jgi:hypothetical protein
LVFLVGSFPLAFPPITYTHFSFPHSVYMSRPRHPYRLDYSNYWLSEFGRKKKTRRHISSPQAQNRKCQHRKGFERFTTTKLQIPGQRSAIPHVTLRPSARWQGHPLFVFRRIASALGRGIGRNLLLGRAAIFKLTSVATAHSIVSHPPPQKTNKNLRHSHPKCEQILCPPGPLEYPFRRKNNFHRKLGVGCYLVVPSSFGSRLRPSTFLAHRTNLI